MTEIIETEKKEKKKGTLSLSQPGKLELRTTVEGGQVRQNFSHGRSKVVAVEVRKKRTFALDSGGQMAEVRSDTEVGEAPPAPVKADDDSGDIDEQEEEALRLHGPTLTTEEKAARVRALHDAQRTEDEAPPVPEAAAEGELSEDEEALAQAEEARRQAEEERRQADEEERRREEQAKAAAAVAAAKLEARQGEEKDWAAEDKSRPRRPGRGVVRRPQAPSPRRGQARRRSGKLTIDQALGNRDERTRSLAAVRRAREKQKQQRILPIEAQPVVREVVIPETITVQELANRMAARSTDVIRSLMTMDIMASGSQVIDADTAELVVSEFGHHFKRVSDADVEIGLKGEDDDAASLVPRAPVVTVMGHVDHGKTSLLDALRKTDVVSGEAGGITQHIGAYQVILSSGGRITFIDTPGHAAFTDMRARGAQVTDIVILVVAAADGIMPQTIEAIDHAKAAEVPIIVAINKIDLPDADANRVRTELLQHDLVVEEMGGEVLAVEVSAKEETNLDKLEEVVLLQAEILDLKSNPDRPAQGTIIESKMERGRGSVATVLVQRGTLRVGDIFVAGEEWGRVRAMTDSNGESVEEAGPSMPVEVVGLNGTPAAGDEVTAVDTETRAREVNDFRRRKTRDMRAAMRSHGNLEDIFAKLQEGEAKVLPVVVKADVHGSVEAIVAALEGLSTDEVEIQVLHSGVGGINESDVTLARASEALIVGFNVRANPQGRELAQREKVEIRYYGIIYEVIDDLKKALSGLLPPTLRENLLGYAEIREIFSVSKVGKVAGCMVTEGTVRRGARVRLLRDDIVIHEGGLSQLKRFKDDVKEVKEGTECGIVFENYQDIQQNDRVECFEVEEVARQL